MASIIKFEIIGHSAEEWLEWFKAPLLKSGTWKLGREFKSHLLRIATVKKEAPVKFFRIQEGLLAAGSIILDLCWFRQTVFVQNFA